MDVIVRAKVNVDNWGITVSVPKPVTLDFPTLMKGIGGKWDDIFHVWRFPKYIMYYKAVKEAVPDLEELDTVKTLFEPRLFAEHPFVETRYSDLYEYQQEASDWLGPRNQALLNLSPGLGKTAVALVTADRLQLENVLVASPLRLLRMWYRECAKWTDREMLMYHGVVPEAPGWYVTNYDTIAADTLRRDFFKCRWDLVILDESVLIKGRDTKRVAALNMLRATFKRTWLLSGSPTSRFYDDLWSQFHFMNPQGFTSYWRFAERYCRLDKIPWSPHPVVVGSRTDRDIRDDFQDIMFVRHQREVLPDLPDFIPEQIEVEMEPLQRKAFDEMKRSLITNLETGKITATSKLAQLTFLQQITSGLKNVAADGADVSGKTETVIELLETGGVEYPIIIWTHWKAGSQALHNRIFNWMTRRKRGETVALVTGDTDEADMDRALAQFQRDELNVLIMSIGVGKYGHTLTEAQTVIYYDKTFDADAYYQSPYRVKRIGLDHRPVVITLKIPHSTDELVEQHLAGKMVSIANVNDADLLELLRNL